MKIGLQIPVFTFPDGAATLGATLANIGRTADAAGFSSIWVMDHLFQIPGGGEVQDPMLEAYGALHFLAGVTQHARLGAMVTAVNYRAPGLLIKTVTTLDVLSGGRAMLGIGAGWNQREATGLGLHFPPLKERFECLEETLQIAHQMWRGDASAFSGKHYHLAEPINSPRALSNPHPPILIGGAGERKTLRLVARYADACNFFAFGDFSLVRQKLEVLRQHCEAAGRDFNAIERTVLLPLGGAMPAPNRLIETCHTLARLGVQQVILSGVPRIEELSPLERIGREVIPAVAGV